MLKAVSSVQPGPGGSIAQSFTDSSGTPGNVTNASPRGRAAFVAAGTTVIVTSGIVTANSAVFVTLRQNDTTLTFIKSVVTAAGSFTVTGNAAATATAAFDFLVVN